MSILLQDIYLTAVYYVIDAIVDKHYCGASPLANAKLAPLAIELSSLAIIRILAFASSNKTLNSFEKVVNLLNNTLRVNSEAIHQELDSRIDVKKNYHRTNEYSHMWGRSNTFIFLIELFFIHSAHDNHKVVNAVKDLLYYLQWGDDIVDWREDFTSKKWTPFLRLCHSNFKEEYNMNNLEEYIYLYGGYEKGLKYVINGIDNFIKNIKQENRTDQLIEFAKYNKQKALTLLQGFIKEKLECGTQFNF